MRSRRKTNWTLLAMLVGVVLLTLAGIALLGAYFYLSRDTSADSGWVMPLDMVVVDNVAPDLAVLPLAGELDDRVIRAALDAGEIETAYAGLAYSVLLPDTLRSGHWLLLANHYRERDPERARVCYQAALDQVALGTTLSDPARADVSLQVAAGFTALDEAWAARLALTQAENIARYSLSMLPAQRRSVLLEVAAGYRTLNDTQTATAIVDDLDAASAGPGIKLGQAAQILPRLRGTVVLPDAVATAIVSRQQAAAVMAARWLSTSPSERAVLGEALGEALTAEDQARAAFYGGAETLDTADRLALLYDQVMWLTIKYRAAQGAYGTVLVPDWEMQIEDIRVALANAYTDLINGYGQQLDLLGPTEAAPARVELLRQGVLWTRLGLFPDPGQEVEATLSAQLHEASRQLWTRQGSVGLTIVMQEVQGRRFYLLSGSESL